jgi:protein TonB
MATRRPKKAATRVSLVFSLVFHAAVIALLGFFAAREGYLGKALKTIAVTMAPKEKPPEPEKPKEPEPKPEPRPEEPRPTDTPPPVVQAPTQPQPTSTAPPPTAVAPAAAPAPVGLPAFNFSDGAKVVDTTSDPIRLYRGFVEFSFRSKWLRPEGLDDAAYVADVEVTVDPTGKVTGSTWQRGSGNAVWDASVKQAVAQTKALSRPPPKGFPGRFLVRFDVVTEVDANQLTLP